MVSKRQLLAGLLASGVMAGGTAALIEAHGPTLATTPTAVRLQLSPTAGVDGQVAALRIEETQLQAAILAAHQKLASLAAEESQGQATMKQQAQALAARESQLAQEASQLSTERTALGQEAAQLSARQSAPAVHATTGASSARSSDDGGGGDG